MKSSLYKYDIALKFPWHGTAFFYKHVGDTECNASIERISSKSRAIINE